MSVSSVSRARLGTLLWWAGVPLVVALFTYAPFLIVRCMIAPVADACWRVPITGEIIFDLFAYLEFMGMAIAQVPGGVHLGLFGVLIQFIHALLPQMSIPELWLLLRWIFGVLSWWLFAWMLRWMGVPSVSARRIAATLLWVGVFLVLGFRPGVYSWFIPVGIIMLYADWRAWAAWHQASWQRGIGWLVLGMLCSIVYPWFFLFQALWSAACLGRWVLPRLPTWGSVLAWTVSAGAIVTIGIGADQLIPTGQWIVFWETLFRNGLAFTHLPLLSTLLLGACAWLALVLVAWNASPQKEKGGWEWWAVIWLVIIAGWVSTVFSGVYLHNDHFRIFVVLFAWASVVYVVAKREVIKSHHTHGHTAVLYISGLIAVLGFGRGLSILMRAGDDYLNLIQLLVWVTVLLGVTALLYADRRNVLRAAIGLWSAVAVAAGLYAYSVQLTQLVQSERALRTFEPGIAAIQAQVPPTDRICSSPPLAQQLAAFSGRNIFFTEQATYARGTDAQLYARMRVFAHLVDLGQPEIQQSWEGVFWSRSLVCNASGVQRLFKKWVPAAQWSTWTGCPELARSRDHAAMISLAPLFGQSHAAVTTECPWIVAPVGAEAQWSIPDTYTQTYADSEIRLFKAH